MFIRVHVSSLFVYSYSLIWITKYVS